MMKGSTKEEKIAGLRRGRRIARTRAVLRGSPSRLRLTVFRSQKHIAAQFIDDRQGKTLFGLSDIQIKKEKGLTKVKRAEKLGRLLAEGAARKGIRQVVFDRGPYRYHGRIRSLAEGARRGGLVF